MRQCRNTQKTIAMVVLVMFCYLSAVVAPLQAALVGTADIFAEQENDLAREKVQRFLERQDVLAHLQSMGVNPEEAKARVDTMTAEEINLMAAKIDQIPAGGDGTGFLLATLLIVIVVLIFTDIFGVTDVFTFIKKR